MKKIYFLSVFVLLFNISNFAQYPTSFSWLGNTPTKENQVIQGPCNVFAAVANMEAWLYILYGQTVNLSQQHMYSKCAFTGPFTTIHETFNAVKLYGLVTTADIIWGKTGVVSCTSGCGDPYFGDNLGPGASACTAPFSAAESFNIGNYEQFDITALYPTLGLSNTDKLKRAIMNSGPISVNLTTTVNSHTQLHNNYSTHAYLIYGWDSSGWLLKDSWPASEYGSAISHYSGDLIGDIANNYTHLGEQASRLVPAAGHSAVYGSMRSSGWGPDPNESQIRGVPVSYTGNNALSITLPRANLYISAAAPQMATVNGLGFLDPGYTIEWFSTPVNPSYASASFGSPNSATTTVSNGLEGYVNINCRVKRANGLAEVITLTNVYVTASLPIKIKQNYDFCSGTTRYVQWQIVGNNNFPLPSSMRVTWNPQFPAGYSYGTTYNTSAFLNDMLTLNLYNMTTGVGYALRPLVTDPGYNNIAGQLTQPAQEQPCTGGHAAIMQAQDGSVTPEEEMVTEISAYPNPATGTLHILLPRGNRYMIRLVSVFGSQVMTAKATGSLTVDISHFTRGMYVLKVNQEGDRGNAVVRKLIFE